MASSSVQGFMGTESDDESMRAMEDAMVARVTDRFERRVAEECGKVRVEMAQGFAGLRGDMAQMESGLRGDMAKMESGLRGDMAQMESGLRGDMAQMESGLREDLQRGLANVRVEVIKWSFLFWVTQVATLAALFLRK